MTVPPEMRVGNRFAYEPSKWNGETTVSGRRFESERIGRRVHRGGECRVADLDSLGLSSRTRCVDHVRHPRARHLRSLAPVRVARSSSSATA